MGSWELRKTRLLIESSQLAKLFGLLLRLVHSFFRDIFHVSFLIAIEFVSGLNKSARYMKYNSVMWVPIY